MCFTNIHTNVRYIFPIQLFPYIYPKIRSTVQHILSFLLVLVSIISGINLNGQQPILPDPPAGYRLVFHDEFDYNGAPDSSKWSFETGFIRNHEPQWYRPQNAQVGNGMLTITVRKESFRNEYYDSKSDDWRINTPSAQYTSASVISKGKFEFRYGKLQARLRINTAKGQWPALWMLGVNRGPVPWPACGEVDIMEYYRGLMHANLAWQGDKGNSTWSVKKHVISQLGDEAFWQEFHIWTMDWDENHIRIYMDDILLNETAIGQIKNGVRGNNPFHEKFYLVMNVALGQGGEEIPDDTLPAEYDIDYIRIYQKE